MKEEKSRIVLKITRQQHQNLKDLSRQLGFDSMSKAVGYIADRAAADALYIDTTLGEAALRAEKHERMMAHVRQEATRTVLKVLHENGFISDPYAK